jgi:AAA15 family ATPase/GTPase
MVLEIRLSNFFSIKDEVVLDLRAANIKTKTAQKLGDNIFDFKDSQVLKTIAVYGANASGKSNIIKAIQFSVMMILNSHNHNENTIFNYKKFKFDNYDKKPSSFFIRFVLQDIEYEYSFSVMQKSIISEELYFYPNNRIAKIFARNENGGETKKEKYTFGSQIKRPFDVAENTSDKTLFISRASQMDRDIAKEIFSYFNETFIIGHWGFNAPRLETLFSLYKKQLLEALIIADSDIVDIKTSKIKNNVKNFTANLNDLSLAVNDDIREELKITSYHKASPNVAFDFFQEESAGTIKLFQLILYIIEIVKEDKILLLDEIEESLHTNIIEYIFNLFRASKKAQLICTTHNTIFLDLSKFRKDQIYFVNKKEDASSDLYSLFDYKDFRDSMDVEKAYLQGRFDAIPIINDSLENLKIIVND